MKQKKHLRGDLVLLGGVLFVGIFLGLFLLLAGKAGGQVEIRVAGEVVKTLPLDKDCTYLIDGAAGGTNRLVIQDGQAWLEEASCPDELCIHMGKIRQTGQSIICLPNQVVIEVIGNGDSAGVDLVAG